MIVVKEATCVSSKVEELIHSFVTEAKQVTDVGAELSFILPSSATGVFPDLFDTLDGMYVPTTCTPPRTTHMYHSHHTRTYHTHIPHTH